MQAQVQEQENFALVEGDIGGGGGGGSEYRNTAKNKTNTISQQEKLMKH